MGSSEEVGPFLRNPTLGIFSMLFIDLGCGFLGRNPWILIAFLQEYLMSRVGSLGQVKRP